MPSRVEIVRYVMEDDWIGGLREHATEDLAIDGSGGIRLGLVKRLFYPDLAVAVDEVAETDDRVFATFTIRSRNQPEAVRWNAAGVFEFRGDQICRIWSVIDHLPWLTAVGAVDDANIERTLDAAAEAAAADDAPPPL